MRDTMRSMVHSMRRVDTKRVARRRMDITSPLSIMTITGLKLYLKLLTSMQVYIAFNCVLQQKGLQEEGISP